MTATITDSEFGYVRDLVLEHAAIVLDSGKTYLVESRLQPIARREGAGTVGALVTRLRNERYGRIHHDVVQAMTTNETSWYRDQTPFHALQHHVIPDLMRNRLGEQRLSIWSAACSTGQEPYTIAMTLKDQFPALESWNVRILASDLSQSVLQQARAGRYTQVEVNRGLPTAVLLRHFTQCGPYWQIKDEIRRMVQFGSVNLAGAWPALPPLDIVFLRNVMIYFDVATKRSILANVRRVLRPDGYLFLGTAETTLQIDDSFERVQSSGATFYRLKA